MQKFRLLREYAQQRDWLTSANDFRPGRAKMALLEQAHCREYLQNFIDNTLTPAELRRLGLPWSEGLLRRTLLAPAGTLLSAQLALQHGIACHLAGGTHHAHRDFGSGFCVINDLAVAAKSLLNSGQLQRLVIFDCDVHQGDGTATILADEPRAFTVSLHCGKNFPARKAMSDRDVELPPGMKDSAYLQTVENNLATVLDEIQPDLLLYDAGVDVFVDDSLGLLDISLEGIYERDRLVVEMARQRAIPCATVIGGGYDRDQRALAARHGLVVEAAFSVWQ